MKALVTLFFTSSALLLTACNDGSDSSSAQTTQASFAVSDAPVDSAQNVYIGFSQIELVTDNGERR